MEQLDRAPRLKLQGRSMELWPNRVSEGSKGSGLPWMRFWACCGGFRKVWQGLLFKNCMGICVHPCQGCPTIKTFIVGVRTARACFIFPTQTVPCSRRQTI